jgi:hypothetical protein
MPASTRPRSLRRSRGPILPVLLLAAALVAACGTGPATSAVPTPTVPPPTPVVVVPPTPVLPSEGLLVTYLAHGGHCRTGTCEFTAEIFADGRVNRSDGMEQVVDPMSLGLLARGIEEADWDAMLAVPFRGECPVNFDGQESVYTFHVAPEPIVVASCTTEVDTNQEPFQTVHGILFGTGG